MKRTKTTKEQAFIRTTEIFYTLIGSFLEWFDYSQLRNVSKRTRLLPWNTILKVKVTKRNLHTFTKLSDKRINKNVSKLVVYTDGNLLEANILTTFCNSFTRLEYLRVVYRSFIQRHLHTYVNNTAYYCTRGCPRLQKLEIIISPTNFFIYPEHLEYYLRETPIKTFCLDGGLIDVRRYKPNENGGGATEISIKHLLAITTDYKIDEKGLHMEEKSEYNYGLVTLEDIVDYFNKDVKKLVYRESEIESHTQSMNMLVRIAPKLQQLDYLNIDTVNWLENYTEKQLLQLAVNAYPNTKIISFADDTIDNYPILYNIKNKVWIKRSTQLNRNDLVMAINFDNDSCTYIPYFLSPRMPEILFNDGF